MDAPDQMPQTTQRRWQAATTLAELGELTAQWLEGRLDSQPGYEPDCGPDEETKPLIAVLAKLNRIGYLTDSSQPGCGPTPGDDGAVWCRRAAVSGFAGEDLATTIAQAATNAGMLVRLTRVGRRKLRNRITVTVREGQPYTAFGARMSARDVALQYEGCSAAGIDAVMAATRLTVVDPQWGDRNTLWDLLDHVAATRHEAVL